ncbi:hypothetical protein F2Q70_00001461 [Brassica cretica]|uniref:Uncharacterized protein n=1 Tax=Brassica cretica TaxID=69181 RepID=A0A8S9IUG8_BRACR|nr:hypothetical protein F2Q70_00001461 [Brassica cretica]
MVATLILVRDDRGNLHGQEGHLRNAAGQRIDVQGAAIPDGTGFQGSGNQGGNRNSYGIWGNFNQSSQHQNPYSNNYNNNYINNRVVKEEKLQEGDFEVESLMSFGGSHWCRSTPSHEHRSTEVIQNRSTSSPGHHSTTPTESTASCKAVRIMTHKEFATKHPHPASPVYVNIDRHSDPTIDRQQEIAQTQTLRNPPETVRTPSDDGVDPMEVDRYETEYSASIETHIATSIDNAHQKSTDTPKEESVDSSPDDWENDYYIPTMETHTMHKEEYDEDYDEERAIEQRATIDEEDRLLNHSSWKRKSPSINNYSSTSIDTQPHQPNHLRESTDNAYFPSIDTNVDATRDGDDSIGSWADNPYHESYAVETAYRDQGDGELNEGFTYEEFLNMQTRDETYQNRAAAAWERTHFSHPIDRESRPSIDTNHSQSIDINNTTSIDIRPIPKTTTSFRQPMEQITCSYINATFQNTNRKSLMTQRFYWEEKDEYGIYRDDQGYARDLDGHTIRVHDRDIRRLLERVSRDEPSYICFPEHASLFTQTKLVTEIYTKDEINEMFYGVCGEHEKNKEAFQMKLDGVYYPLNDSISWLTNFMEKMKQDIARIQSATDVARPTSIDNRLHTSIDSRLSISIDNRIPASVDDNLPLPHLIKSQPDFHTDIPCF